MKSKSRNNTNWFELLKVFLVFSVVLREYYMIRHAWHKETLNKENTIWSKEILHRERITPYETVEMI